MDRHGCRSPIASGVAAAAFAAALTAAPAARAEGCAPPTAAMRQIELYFGSSVKGLPFVTEQDWSEFLATEVTPKFPDGLTVLYANGQWRSGDERIIANSSTCSSLSSSPTPRPRGRSRRSAALSRINSARKTCPCGWTRRSAPPFDRPEGRLAIPMLGGFAIRPRTAEAAR